MVAFPDADSGAEEDEPAHQDDGRRFTPDQRIVEDVAGEHLGGDEDGHQNEPGSRQPQSKARDVAQGPRDGFHCILHLQPPEAGKGPWRAIRHGLQGNGSVGRADAGNQSFSLSEVTCFS
jgi:hypothetical protein